MPIEPLVTFDAERLRELGTRAQIPGVELEETIANIEEAVSFFNTSIAMAVEAQEAAEAEEAKESAA